MAGCAANCSCDGARIFSLTEELQTSPKSTYHLLSSEKKSFRILGFQALVSGIPGFYISSSPANVSNYKRWRFVCKFSVNAVFYFPRVHFTSYLTPSKRNMSFQVSTMYIWFLEFVFLVFVSFLSR